MDDGLGFSIGSIFGGFLFQTIGGRRSFQIFSIIAFITCLAHIFLRPAATHEIRTLPNKPNVPNFDDTKVENVTKSSNELKEEEEEETFDINK